MSTAYNVKTLVLQKNLTEQQAQEMIEKKKASAFRSILSGPKKEDVHVHSIDLCYECILVASGRYVANYYKKASHAISVAYNVKDVTINNKIFQVRAKSRLARSFSKRGRNKVDIKLEEHVYTDEQGSLAFDHHGQEIKFPYKNPGIEDYPDKVLKEAACVRNTEMEYGQAIQHLEAHLKRPLQKDVSELDDEFTLQEMAEYYVPIFEARLTAPRNKVKIVRIDAARAKAI